MNRTALKNMLAELPAQVIYHLMALDWDHHFTDAQWSSLVRHEWMHVQFARVYGTRHD